MINSYCNFNRSKSFLEKKGVKKYSQNNLFAVSKIGCGTYLGLPNETVDRMYIESIKKSVNLGVNFLDTAINYRGMRSEILVGKAVKELIEENTITREEVVIATKGGFIPADYRKTQGLDETFRENHRDKVREFFLNTICSEGNLEEEQISDILGAENSIHKDFISWCFEESRKNLNLETIDIYYLHNPSNYLKYIGEERFYTDLLDTFKFLERQVEKGYLKSYGIATSSGFLVGEENENYLSLNKIVDTAKTAGGENHHLKFIQLPFNKNKKDASILKNQSIGRDNLTILEAAEKLNISVITNVSLDQSKSKDIYTIDEMIEFLVDNQKISSSLLGMKTIKYVPENVKNIL